jgi:PLP dependent protein
MTTLPRPVNADLSVLSARLAEVRSRIRNAAKRSGREGSEVRLIGVVKNVAAETVREAVTLGLADLGENRVQEAEQKIAAVGCASEGRPFHWHLIGHLQRNKAARAVQLFDRVHSVDRLEIAEALSRHAAASGRKLPVLIEVNVSREATKFGVAAGALKLLAEQIAKLDALSLDGLMTVGAPAAVPDQARAGFAELRALRDRTARSLGIELPQLSMGMSGDFEVAIEEGSTMVRVGTAIFGAREAVMQRGGG